MGSRVRRDGVMSEICHIGNRSPVLLHPHSLAAVRIVLFRCENIENHVRMHGLENQTFPISTNFLGFHK